jgi:hypothetical protein
MASTVDAEVKAPKKSKWYRQLYFWVIVAIARRSSRRCGC